MQQLVDDWKHEFWQAGAACYADLDATYRSCCCEAFSACGLRDVYPSDPFFEPTVLDHFVINPIRIRHSDEIAAHAEWIEEQIVKASPRIAPNLLWLCCTSDTWCCGRYPRTEEARLGFRVIRRAKVADFKTGKTYLTVWPKYQDEAEATMRNLKDQSGRRIDAQVMDRSSSGRKYALLEAVPVDIELLKKRPADRIPMAKVLCNDDESTSL